MRYFFLCCGIGSFLLSGAMALAGDVTGTVTFSGTMPKPAAIDMTADPVCRAKHKTAPVSEALLLGPGQTMANILVRVKSGYPKKEYPVPGTPAVIEQIGCIYVPRVLGMMKGQVLKIRNDDGLMHNVHAIPAINRKFNVSMPGDRKETDKNFAREVEETPFPIQCDVHPWMKTWVAVYDHPYFAVTGRDGKFAINDVPPGEYELEVWHEKMGTQVAKITVTESGGHRDFVFKR